MKKKNVVIISGSANPQSLGVKYIRNYINELEREMELNTIFHSLNKINIHPCQGCSKCFSSGICALDKRDDMEMVKKNLLLANVIIFHSPVYLHNVSGYFKNFMDRIAYWAHLFRLLGKPLILVITSSLSGLEKVDTILSEFANNLGVIKVDTVYITSKDTIENIDKKNISIVANILQGEKQLEVNSEMELLFTGYKIVFKNYPKNSYEYQYWNDNKLFEANSLQELVEM